jgi:RNA 2',3'-cyclic 3'-phosphodiesterase
MSEHARRLFIGIRVSVATANALAGAVETLARRAGSSGLTVRWMPATHYHVTLKFLGWTHVDATSALVDVVREAIAGVTPFSFSTARLGAFPKLDAARVVWAGVTSRDDVLGQLAHRIDEATTALGFAPAGPWVGHVTLGRLREPVAIAETLLPLMEQMFSDTKVTGISLLESTLKSGSLVYREVSHFEFFQPEIDRKRQSPPVQLEPQSASSAHLGTLSVHEIDTDDGWPRGHIP